MTTISPQWYKKSASLSSLRALKNSVLSHMHTYAYNRTRVQTYTHTVISTPLAHTDTESTGKEVRAVNRNLAVSLDSVWRAEVRGVAGVPANVGGGGRRHTDNGSHRTGPRRSSVSPRTSRKWASECCVVPMSVPQQPAVLQH